MPDYREDLFWNREDEDEDWLNSLPDADEELATLMRSGPRNTFDPREVLKVENQSQQGACQGHAITSVTEWCWILSTGDTSLQLSRAYGYYETQRIDGIRGDRGSTISGGCKLAKEVGICREALWEYPDRYNPKRPRNFDECLQDAKKYKILEAKRLRSYDAIAAFLGAYLGGINIGISWGNGMSKSVVERHAGGGGGHAIGLFSLSDRLDSRGRNYVWMMNSWGKGFGNQGWSEWSPTAIEQMMRDRSTVAIGCSETINPKPRELTFQDVRDAFRSSKTSVV